MEQLILNKDLRKSMGEQAIKLSTKFKKENIDKQWSDLISCIFSKTFKSNIKDSNSHSIFPIEKIMKLSERYNQKYKFTFWEKIFSIHNPNPNTKIILILGIKFIKHKGSERKNA